MSIRRAPESAESAGAPRSREDICIYVYVYLYIYIYIYMYTYTYKRGGRQSMSFEGDTFVSSWCRPNLRTTIIPAKIC